ncbi:GntR family transcriptional regulator [Gordonia paraffinivorans]|uniref:GntR family transcriptional regulator n=1 Tax=Gordonia paraffinivorans TaxID=175628 RepID=UPI003FCE16FC
MATSAKTRSGTTVDELCTALRERIVTGEYFPGQRMPQEQLAAEFKVSRTPLREAFKRLEADGLLVATANRGVHVAPISNSDTEQNYALRILIEPPIVATLTEQLTDTEIEQMQTVLADMRKYRGHSKNFQKAHKDFHDVIRARYPKSFADLTHNLYTMIHRHQSVYLSHQRTPEDFIDLDQDLIDAIVEGRPDSARRILEFHLIDAALGLVLDADPDHEFDSLLVTLRGRDIVIEHDETGHIPRPARIYWRQHDDVLPARTTSNLILTYAPK